MEEERLKDFGQDESVSIASTAEGLALGARFCPVIAIDPFSPEGSRDIALRAPTRKYFWAAGTMARWGQSKFLCVFETPEEYLGFPGDATASTSPWPELWEEAEPDPRVWRGVFYPIYDRKILFSEEVLLKTADLPRWQPKVMIDRRTLETENE